MVAQPLLAVRCTGCQPVPPRRSSKNRLILLENWSIVDAGECVTRGPGRWRRGLWPQPIVFVRARHGVPYVAADLPRQIVASISDRRSAVGDRRYSRVAG